ncbi:hypothetical protein ACOGYE_001897 [Edwardsiella piscicida]
MTTITKEQAQKIIDAADEVISALAGDNDDIHPEIDALLRTWDDTVQIQDVRELARIALASMEADQVPGNELFVSGVIEHGGYCEATEVDELADFFTVYQRDQDGLRVALFDCCSRYDAEIAVKLLCSYTQTFGLRRPPVPVVLDEAQSRELFEKWCPVNIERNKWHTDQYAHLPARQQWNAWNACRAAMLKSSGE